MITHIGPSPDSTEYIRKLNEVVDGLNLLMAMLADTSSDSVPVKYNRAFYLVREHNVNSV